MGEALGAMGAPLGTGRCRRAVEQFCRCAQDGTDPAGCFWRTEYGLVTVEPDPLPPSRSSFGPEDYDDLDPRATLVDVARRTMREESRERGHGTPERGLHPRRTRTLWRRVAIFRRDLARHRLLRFAESGIAGRSGRRRFQALLTRGLATVADRLGLRRMSAAEHLRRMK